MRQTCVCGIVIVAALGFAPPASAGVVNVPTPKVNPLFAAPKVTAPKVTGAKVGTKVGRPPRSYDITTVTPQTPTVTTQTPSVTPQTPKVTSQKPTLSYDQVTPQAQ